MANVSPLIILFIFAKMGVSTEQIGAINYYFALVTILGIFTDFGLPELIQRTVPIATDQAAKLSNLLIAELGIATLVGAIFLAVDRLTGIAYGQPGLLFFVIVASSCNTFILGFNALASKIRVSIYFGANAALFTGISTLLVLSGQEASEAFLLGRALSWLIILVIVSIDLFWQGLFTISLHRFDYKYVVNIVLGNLGNALIGQWDGIITSLARGFAANGIYKSASLVGSLPQGISTILSTKLLPEYSVLITSGRLNEVKASVRKVAIILSGIGICSAFVLVFLGKPLLTFVFNLEIAENAYIYLPLIFLSSSLWAAISPAISALQAAGKANIYRNILVIQVALYLLTSGLLIQQNFIFLPVMLLISTILASAMLLTEVHRLTAIGKE